MTLDPKLLAQLEPISAVLSGVADLWRVVKEAKDRLGMYGTRNVRLDDDAQAHLVREPLYSTSKPPFGLCQ